MAPHSIGIRIRLGLIAIADSLRLARAIRGRERVRMLRAAARAFATIASRQPLVGRILPTPRTREYELRPEPGAPSLRLRTNDMVVMEVYGGRPYELDYSPLERVRSILDLGANAGVASAFLAARFPDARIVAVEPSPATFDLLTENLRRISAGAVAVRAAVVSTPGVYRLEPGAAPANDRIVVGDAADSDRFEALTLTELIDRHLPDGVDLMKVDIEGGEGGLFETVGEWGHRVRAVVAETHAPLTARAAEEKLRSAGFERLPVPSRRAHRDIVFCARADASPPRGDRA